MYQKLPSPSQQLSYMLCPGFLQSSGPSEFADRGTELHLACELEDPSMIDDPGDQQLVELALTHRNQRIKNMVRSDPERWGGDWTKVRMYKEKHLRPPPDSDEKGGTIDVLVVPPSGPYRVAAIMDYKFGYKPVVPAADNPQMIAYAMRVICRYPHIEFVDVSILIPALRAATHYRFTRREIERKYHGIQTVVLDKLERSDDPESYRPGTACTYCGRKETGCPALRLPFLEVVANENNLPSIPTGTWDLANASENQLSTYRTLASMMKDFSDTVKKSIDEEVTNRGLDTLPEYRRVTRRGYQVVNNPANALVMAMNFQGREDKFMNLIPLVFPEKSMKLDKFIERAVQFLHLVIDSPLTGDYNGDWENLKPNSSFKAFIEDKRGASYLAKAPRRGYVDMLDNTAEYELMEMADDVYHGDPHDIVDPQLLTDTTEIIETDDTNETSATTESPN